VYLYCAADKQRQAANKSSSAERESVGEMMPYCTYCRSTRLMPTGQVGKDKQTIFYMCSDCGLMSYFDPAKQEPLVMKPCNSTDGKLDCAPTQNTTQNTTQKPTEQTNSSNWLDAEIEAHEQTDFEKVDGLKFEENKITEFTVDFSLPFEKKSTEFEGVSALKAIIPVLQNGAKKNWWLNVKNPLYTQVLVAGRKGTTNFKVMRTGSAKGTKYILVQ
jgi:hypothetical protein